MRGAARQDQLRKAAEKISTHAPHARRGKIHGFNGVPAVISTHAPHARRGTMMRAGSLSLTISTHAPHARRGRIFFQPVPILADFYSRASCEARLFMLIYNYKNERFLLTRLMRGAALPQC